MECAKYRVKEEKLQDQRLIAEWAKNKEGEKKKEKSRIRLKENK